MSLVIHNSFEYLMAISKNNKKFLCVCYFVGFFDKKLNAVRSGCISARLTTNLSESLSSSSKRELGNVRRKPHGDIAVTEDYDPVFGELNSNSVIHTKKEQNARKITEDDHIKGLEQTSSYFLDPESLIPGDIVVHYKYGTAKFLQIKREVPKGKLKPVRFIFLEFADGVAKVSFKEAQRVLFRFGSELGHPIRLSRIRDRSLWEKKKRKTQQSIRKLIQDMMDLRVARMSLTRPKYQRNTSEMEKFNKEFPYILTEDQLQAILDIEKDMTSSLSPMDRLVCGDVGFGKTEVAMRAVHLAVSDGRQVLVLTPTTVLARQHTLSFKERFKNFPSVRIACLSRFLTSREKKEAIEAISSGEVDIAVGTHALLNESLAYERLGLLIVDEEQKFGVRHKEKITSLRKSVDVLTLTATPIPRTLYMASSGLRDVSVMKTPPPERLPITSVLSQYKPEVVKEAIGFELLRGGQVFYVVPHVTGIEEKFKFLSSTFPEAIISVAHGQLPGHVLEDAMEQFQAGKTQILLCTTIIESGVDVGNCNTIIVENVHKFGLSQLYQLRGRVGRSSVKAFAYLFHPHPDCLTPEAKLRLQALEECSNLGEGFNLAEKDMQIRGVGSVFGEEQSGNMSLVGKDLYLHLVRDTTRLLKEKSSLSIDPKIVEIELSMDLRLSLTCFPDNSEREKYEAMFTKVLGVSVEAIADVGRSLMKSVGKGALPATVKMYIKVLCVKHAASKLGIREIYCRGKKDVIMISEMSEELFSTMKGLMDDQEMAADLSYVKGKILFAGIVALPPDLLIDRLMVCLLDMNNIEIPAMDW